MTTRGSVTPMKRLLPCLMAVALLAAACGDDGDETAADRSSTTTAAPSTSTPTSTTAADACPAGDFLTDLDGVDQADGYGTVALTATCDEDSLLVASNGLIDYEFVAITPNDLAAVDQTWDLPLEPEEAEVPGAMGLGVIGVAVNGIPLFGAFEAPRDGYGDPLSDGLLDACNGHTAPGGMYHYHARYGCLFEDPDQPGLVYGYANDGYAIVAPYECTDDGCTSTESVSPSYVRVDESSTAAFEAWEYQRGAGDLDECNGRTDADGVYRYYLTDTFPYLPFCYHGVTDAAVGDFAGEPPTEAAGLPAMP